MSWDELHDKKEKVFLNPVVENRDEVGVAKLAKDGGFTGKEIGDLLVVVGLVQDFDGDGSLAGCLKPTVDAPHATGADELCKPDVAVDGLSKERVPRVESATLRTSVVLGVQFEATLSAWVSHYGVRVLRERDESREALGEGA